MAIDPRHLLRLQEEQKKAIEESDSRIEQLEKFKSDYRTLRDRLKTFPDELSYEVMVPFTTKAFMPGQIVHTNEILVLLGDNWFVERSAKQASEIAGRRIKELNKNIEDLKAQRKLLEPRLDFTSDLHSELQGGQDVKEIVEEYDEEKERIWDEQHRKNVRRYKEQMKKEDLTIKSTKKQKDDVTKTETNQEEQKDRDLWKKLDELERREEERKEMDSSFEERDISDDEETPSNQTLKTKPEETTQKRHVLWEDEKTETESDESSSLEDDESDDDDNEGSEDGDDEGEERIRPLRKTIKFSHSKTPAVLPHQVNASGDAGIHSPSDIYKLFSPKPILKSQSSKEKFCRDDMSSAQDSKSKSKTKSRVGFAPADEEKSKVSDDEDDHAAAKMTMGAINASAATLDNPALRSSAQKAFTGVVKEHVTPNLQTGSACSSQPTVDTKTVTQDEPPKRISKFRAGRLKQNPP